MAAPRVVIIDDSQEILSLLADILHQDGPYDVRQYAAASVSLEEIAAARPDGIVLDLHLGGSVDAGWDLLTDIRSPSSPLASVPVILCTADLQQLRDRQDRIDEMADVHVVEKPFDIASFETVVAKITPHARA